MKANFVAEIQHILDDDGFDKATAIGPGERDAGCHLVIDFQYTGAALVGSVENEDANVLYNPAVATPGLPLMSAKDLKRFGRSDHYGAISKNDLSRPALVLDR